MPSFENWDGGLMIFHVYAYMMRVNKLKTAVKGLLVWPHHDMYTYVHVCDPCELNPGGNCYVHVTGSNHIIGSLCMWFCTVMLL